MNSHNFFKETFSNFCFFLLIPGWDCRGEKGETRSFERSTLPLLHRFVNYIQKFVFDTLF